MTNRIQPNVILFDLDGTLIDSAPDLGAAAERMRQNRGMPPLGLGAYRCMAGAGAKGMLGVALGITPDSADYEALKEEFLANYEACMTVRTRAFNGVGELLRTLQQHGMPWGIVTNKATRFTEPLIRALPELTNAQVVISGDTTPHPKPHPAPLLEAARQLGVPSSNCLYVGDDERDMTAGRAALMQTVAAGYGYLGEGGNIHSWGADFVIESPLDLLNLLDLA